METAAALKESRERDQVRRIFTRTAITIETNLKNNEFSKAILDIEYLKEKATRLETLDKIIQDRILESDGFSEKEYEAEIDKADSYRRRWCNLRSMTQTGISQKVTAETTPEKETKRKYKLPQIIFKQFDDQLLNWLGFWGQFKKIHEDTAISGEDKFQYLVQAMKEGSNALTLVESFPPSAENYLKAVAQLQARFGREDLLIQVYVRQLLGLVLNHNKNQVSVKTLYDKLSTYLLSLETLGIVKHKYETILYPLVESAIPETILIAWNRSNTDQSSDQLAKLLNFLKCEVETEERIKLARSDFSNCVGANPSIHRKEESSLPTAASLVSNLKPKTESGKELHYCCFCDKGNNHSTFECSKANNMSLDEKKQAIKKKGCCYICLRKNHTAKNCKSFVKCICCEKRHFVIVCPEVHKKKPTENVLICTRKYNTTTLLQTLIVSISHKGRTKKVRALIDSGSQRSYVKAAVVKELEMQPTGTEKIGHVLFGGVEQPAEVHKCFELQVSSFDKSYTTNIIALQQAELCGHLPKIRNLKLLKKLRALNIEISDYDYTDTEISLLIGSDYLGSIITDKLVHLDNNLVAVKTNLGWTLQGPIETKSTVNTTSISCFSKTNLSDLWSVELLGIKDPYEKQCKEETETEILKVFNDNVSVNTQGRYEVPLLWKKGCPELGTNYEVACKRLESTTKKLKSTGNLLAYDKVLQDWKKEDIIEEVTNNNIKMGHYIPHHSVIKPSSSTTRIRPVFDASAKDKNGWSLNGGLDKGINMIELLPKLLIQFRKGAYGVVSDIKQAFLQISITEKDRDYLKFLWWENTETCDKIVTYRHKRVVFGITCSPFLLSATIKYHLERCAEDYKKTAAKLKESFYVDNCVASFDSINELNTFISESKSIMAEGLFDLRGWVTAPHRLDDTATVAVLGMTWRTLQDDLQCNVNINQTIPSKITKRYVISVAQHVFDPLGFVCPTTLIPKLIMQKVWEQKVDWDQEIPTELAQEFKNWLKTAHLINQCHFPRRISAAPVEECETSLHIFCDASQRSFASCVFLRTQQNEKVHIQLILAKNRVAPAKRKMSLPRLELMGALIAARLYKEVIESGLLAECKHYKVYFWTDAAVVLAWITRQTQWKPFVSNRVKEICATTNRKDWHHLPGDSNCADLPSRGCNAKKLLESKWWEGPAWLHLNAEKWPKSSIVKCNEEVVQAEVLRSAAVSTNVTVEPFSKKLMKFSKYNRIVRLVAWILRWSCRVRKKFNVYRADITNDEYINAEKSLFKLLQRENFTEEKTPRNLNTMIDDEGIMRVRTRLELSQEDKDFVSPVLLPGKNEIIQRMVQQRHEKLNHAGTQLLMSNVRNGFWILNMRRLAKSIVSRCIICKRDKSKHYEVPEGPLPTDRIEATEVFQVTGIDLAGPLYLRDQGKCWIVLFTCATYRAVHLELVESLSTNSFLMALRRFIARRGRIKVIYTDCGGCFQGSANLLKEVDWSEVEAATATVAPPIKWRFLPPRAPWWGGWWERLIQILKGKDGHCRTARVQLASGEWTRPVQRLYPLELAAVTDEWRRASTGGGKPETDINSTDPSPEAVVDSDISDDAQPHSVTTRHGRVVKIPQRLLE